MNRNRLLLLAAAVGAAVVVAVVLILVGLLGSSTSSAPPPTTTQATPAPKEVLAGIPQYGDTLGKAGAPVTLIVYEDPQCPFCRRWNVETLPTVVSEFVRTGKIKLVYRGVVIVGPDSVRGLRAIYAAGKQNKLWNLADALYAHQGVENSGWITNGVILAAASEAGANGQAILAGMGARAVNAALVKAQKQATADQLRGTPTFMIERPPALSHQLAVPGLDPASFVAALSAALQ
ncbi:MAG TPA: thioredoxin domain-containing protein [Gaiellaceae bacterium]